MNQTARLLITCADKPGIVAAVTSFLYSHGANITALDQHSTDATDGTFFMRLEFTTPRLDVSGSVLEHSFQETVAKRFEMTWRISYACDLKRVAIFVSGHDHCLLELLWRHSRGELPCDIRLVAGNHPGPGEQVERFGLRFAHFPVTPQTRDGVEEEMLALLEGQTDLVVLARYMQILSSRFVSRYKDRIINIHHSFLPAFAGADPYRQAFERGVKIVGATAHYVTEELDAGPIIGQDIARVSHRQSVEDLKEIGRDLERQVLARAVRAHLEDRVIITGNKTVVF